MKKIIFYFLVSPFLCSCQIGYLVSSSYNQIELWSHEEPILEYLKFKNPTEEERKKLTLTLEVKDFAENELHLKKSKSYSKYVKLDRDYVTYVVSAAQKWKLEKYEWNYPIVGKMPYKGFFNKQKAEDEENLLKEQGLDTYLRGVSAYSTIGWFNDPLLSSMIKYKDHDLVNTIIHELTHTTLYIKNAADFNERLASFVGSKGTEKFYLKKEGPNSETLEQIKKENEDEKLFSLFITEELKKLKKWFDANSSNEELKNEQFKSIQNRFQKDILPLMKTDSFVKFKDLKLNNARLLIYKTYIEDLSDFQKLYELSNENIEIFLSKCKALENSSSPEKALKELIKK